MSTVLNSEINRITKLCAAGDIKTLREALKAHPQMAQQPLPLLECIKVGALDSLSLLIEQGADILVSGGEALNRAAAGRSEILQVFLAKLEALAQNNPEAVYGRGVRMLTAAAEAGAAQNLALIYGQGYGSKTPDHLDKAMDEAAKHGHLDCYKFLAGCGGRPTLSHSNHATENGHKEILQFILERDQKLTPSRNIVEKVVRQRETTIGTEDFARWADLAAVCEPQKKAFKR